MALSCKGLNLKILYFKVVFMHSPLMQKNNLTSQQKADLGSLNKKEREAQKYDRIKSTLLILI